MEKDNNSQTLVPSAVVGKQGEIITHHPGGPLHSLQGTRAVAAGLTSQAEQAIAHQAGSGDMEMAKVTMEKLREFQEFLKRLAFRDLGEGDFVRFSSITKDADDAGRPWLTVGAAERVAETCGIAYGFLEPSIETEEGEDSGGPYFIRRARMWFRVGSRYVEAIGEIDSRDDLLSHRGELTAAQVPKTKIGQKAISRATQIGIGKILGLRSMTWDRVQELCGGALNLDKVKGAKFKGGSGGGGINTGSADDRATSAQVGRLYGQWCRTTGRQNGRNDGSWEKNMKPYWAFVCEALGLPPDTKPKRWAEYTKGEIRKAMEHLETIKAKGGSDA